MLGVSFLSQPADAAVTYRAAATANNGAGTTTLSLGMPTGTTTNDIMIAVISVRGGSGVTVTVPAGWAFINEQNTSTPMKNVMYYKIATSTDAGPYDFTFSVANKASGVIASYSGVDTAQPIDVNNSQTNTSSTTLTAPSLTTTVANSMLVAGYGTATSTTMAGGSGMNIRGYDASTGNGGTSRTTTGLQDVLQPAIGASGAKTMTAGSGAINAGNIIALRPAPVSSQAKYRFFQNTDSTTASTPYAASDTPAVIAPSTPFRLRLNVGNANGSTTMTNVSTRRLNLQYALRGSDNACDTSFANETYADVSTSTPVRYYNNPTPASGAAYVTSANDPTRTGITSVPQGYFETTPFTFATNVPGNQDSLWDVALTTSGVAPGQVYCLRVINSNSIPNGTDNSLLNSYGSMPEFSIPAPTVGQANYRWFANADSLTPGAPLVAQDTSASVAAGTTVRLRQRLAVNVSDVVPSGGSYKLQYAEKVGTCDIAFSGEAYTDLFNTSASSQTTSAGAAAKDASVGTLAWSNIADAAGQDGLSASAQYKPVFGASTNYIVTSGHGFSIPGNAIINGISIGGTFSTSLVGLSVVTDYSVKIVKGGVLQAADRGTNSSWGTGTTWGGATDLWGTTWTPSDVNDPSFGAAISAYVAGDGSNPAFAYVDDITITVYYSVPTTGVVQYGDNPSVNGPAGIATVAGDPTNAARGTVYQSYYENDPYTNASTITNGSDGMWDFPILANAGAAGKTYCFRTVKSSGGLLDSYTQIPELTVVSSGTGPTLDQQLRGGQSVLNGIKQPTSW